MASMILLGDIGGTNSRLGLNGASGRPERVSIIENDTVAGLEGAIARFLEETGTWPTSAVLAVAAPLDGCDEIALTNRAWRFRPTELKNKFGFANLRIVNDFEAIAWSLSRLDGDDARPLGPRLAARAGVKAALGPGTGLGVAALVPADGRSFVVSSEGGHASFGGQTDKEMEIFARLARTHGHVSAETILSGPGLVRLARAADPDTQHDTPQALVQAAVAGDPKAKEAAQLFVRLLGRFAGDIALIFKAFGGVYIAGGVASRLAPLIDEREFRAAFEAHPPYEAMLKDIPTFMMSRTEPGLLGCAVLADQFAS
jgi:glucokinase